ncbi:phosphoribosylamine--glycine ligase [Vaginisenegalia massiliensis]|uniref:phosphoribosylamine--glycine ligase n=1 Tax=Vaginisenegalia massiliensis TaxID=2058294 RepID=UPI000F5436F3|nr:phosphoribosylamine--glycine ligase [Vaginisenegalia massiliensis]
MKKVMVIGSGGREHALALAFAKSDSVDQVFVVPGNPGMELIKEGYFSKISCQSLDMLDFASLVQFAKSQDVAYTFVGPEVPLSQGIVDYFRFEGLDIVGPRQKAAQLEGSKAFAKGLMDRAGVPTARYQAFQAQEYHQALAYLYEQDLPIVIKQDGLAAGKGVIIAESLEVAESTLQSMMQEGQSSVVIEEFLTGEEFSFFALVNEEQIIPVGVAQDFKRAYDNDQGLNTGGMGAYSPVSWVDSTLKEQVINQVLQPLLKQMVAEDVAYTGVLYAGLMQTAKGPKVIEFNARFGDPETQILLPLIDTPFDQLIEAHLAKADLDVKLSTDACLGVVLAAQGYPGSYEKGMAIELPTDFPQHQVCFAGVTQVNGKLVTNGGRILMITSRQADLEACRQEVYSLLEQVKVDKSFYRKDIGLKAVQRLKGDH